MSPEGSFLLAAVCDGMGGLAKGEDASTEMARALSGWFERDLPVLARRYGGLPPAESCQRIPLQDTLSPSPSGTSLHTAHTLCRAPSWRLSTNPSARPQASR